MKKKKVSVHEKPKSCVVSDQINVSVEFVCIYTDVKD